MYAAHCLQEMLGRKNMRFLSHTLELLRVLQSLPEQQSRFGAGGDGDGSY